jgi:3',5'-cyclic AMP phosphodiesterase CpdA
MFKDNSKHKEVKLLPTPISILHISDLHRSKNNPVSNNALLISLLRDSDKYQGINIERPCLIIVSGDIIQGSNDDTEIKNQYKEAEDFLSRIANELLDGDRSRLVIVPGNHDVDWTISEASMEELIEKTVLDKTGALKKSIYSELAKSDSLIRWSWKSMKFLKIIDIDLYNKRFSAFSDFYNSFYRGQKSFSLKPEEQYEIFDYPALNVTVVGFNSCFKNDHLNRAGSIHSECIAKVSISLREFNKKGRLILATWHHNTKGMPKSDDYINDSFISNLISDKVKIGLHGHQHKQEIIKAQTNVVDGESMLILSAGSLCAGPNEIPTGFNQQFNIIELQRTSDDYVRLKVLSRLKTSESDFNNPIWDTGLLGNTANKFETDLKHRLVKGSLSDVELFVRQEKYGEALEILLKQDKTTPIVRTFLLECLLQLDMQKEIQKEFRYPQNPSESIALLNSLIEYRDQNILRETLINSVIAKSSDPSVIHLRQQLESFKK